MPHSPAQWEKKSERYGVRFRRKGVRRIPLSFLLPVAGLLTGFVLLFCHPSAGEAQPRISFADVAAGSLEPVRSALEEGANPDETDRDGQSLLEIAAAKGRFSMVRLLIHYGADPDLPDISGKTPLYRAAQNGYPEIVRILVAHGADPNRTDGEGTAMDWAIANRHRAIVSILEHWTQIRRHYLLRRLPHYLNLVPIAQRSRLSKGSLISGRLPYALPRGILAAPWKSRDSFVEEALRADIASRSGLFGKRTGEPLWRRRAIEEIGRNLKGYRPPM